MKTRRLLLAIFVAVTLHDSSGEEGDECLTPDQKKGTCINIKACDHLLNLLRTQGRDAQVRQYLRSSNCGFSGSDPLVCCPQDNPQTTTTVRSAPSLLEAAEEREPELSVVRVSPTMACGFSNLSNSRIVGGSPAELNEFPWMSALGYRNPANPTNPRWLCGGSLITPRHVVTAAHCAYRRKDLYLVRLGDLDLYDNFDGATPEDIPILQVKLHEKFNSTSYTNDIAMITLMRRYTNPMVLPICIPAEKTLQTNSFEKYTLLVAGWGAIYFNGPTSTNLQKVGLPVVKNSECKEAFKRFKTTVIDNRVICAGYVGGEKDACQGDSGGPLMYGKFNREVSRFYLIGIVSYGFRCAEAGYPGVYTRVTQFIDWIQKNTN